MGTHPLIIAVISLVGLFFEGGVGDWQEPIWNPRGCSVIPAAQGMPRAGNGRKPGMPGSWEWQKAHCNAYTCNQPALHRAWVIIFTSAARQTGNVDADRVYITVVLSFSWFPFTPDMTLLLHSLIPCSNRRLKSSHTFASSSLVSSTSGEQLQPLGEFPCRVWNRSLCVFSLFSACSPEESSALEESVSLCLQIVLSLM